MVKPGWEQRLKPASFRGVPFGTFDYSTDGGRRVALHEYPFRDDNYPEDMGLASDSYQINAFVLGDDHDQAADALEAALRKKGAGELVHQRHGTINVQIQTYQRSESTQSGGMTKFSITAVIAGKPRYPNASRNAQADVLSLASALRTLNISQTLATATQLYAALNDGSLLSAQIASATSALAGKTSWLGSATGGNSSLVAAALSGGGAATLSAPLSGFLFEVAATVSGVSLLPMPLLDTASGGWLTQAAAIDRTALAAIYPTAIATCVDWLTALPTAEADAPASLWLLPAAQAVALTLQTASAAALLPYDSYSAAIAARDNAYALLDALPTALRITSPSGHVPLEQYDGLRELRVLIADAIQQQALTLPQISYVDVSRPTPAMVLSHRLASDATTTADLINRNRIPHPLFCSGMMEYLTRG